MTSSAQSTKKGLLWKMAKKSSDRDTLWLHVQGIVILRSSVTHIGRTSGVESEFVRLKYLDDSGEAVLVPVISGNSIRGQLRDLIGADFMRRLGLRSKALAGLLLEGGGLSKGTSSNQDLERNRMLREAIPALSLFGGALDNAILRGKMSIGLFVPIAYETRAYLPPSVQELATHSVYEFMQSEEYTHTADHADPRYAEFFAPGAGDERGVQMRYTMETMCAGTPLFWHYILMDVTPVEADCFLAALRLWSRNPVLGGKSSTGHGAVEVDLDNGWHITPYAHNLPEPRLYDSYIEKNADWIGSLVATL